MADKKSFSEVEFKYWGDYRMRMSKAQGAEEVKKIFSMIVADMVKDIDFNLDPVYGEFNGDFEVEMNGDTKYRVAPKIKDDLIYIDLIQNSDLPAILDKYAEFAVNKIIHLSKREPIENGKKIIHQ